MGFEKRVKQALLQHQKKSHLEPFVSGYAVQSVFVKTEIFALEGKAVIDYEGKDYTISAGENYCISRRAMRCETGALIECHKHEFHCVVAYHINVRDTAILI